MDNFSQNQCKNCGNIVSVGSNFCARCGISVSENYYYNPMKDRLSEYDMPRENYTGNANQQQRYLPPRQSSYQSYKKAESTNTVAVAGFVLGCLGVICGLWVAFLAGFIVSIIGLLQTNETGEKGKGLAIAGISIGAIGITVSILSANILC